MHDSRPVRRLAALAAVTLLTGCGHDAPPKPGHVVVAPPQRTSLIAAVLRRAGNPPTFNPPRFDLVTLRTDGSEQNVLVQAPSGFLQRVASPAWSADGKRLYFVGAPAVPDGSRVAGIGGDVFVVAAGGEVPQRVTSLHDVVSVVPSPDGDTLLLERGLVAGASPSGLWLTDDDGRNVRRLLDDDDDDSRWDRTGSWSPDGGTIAFTRCPVEPPDESGFIANTCAVYTVARGGSGLRKLADRSSDPSFSPNGTSIAFVSDRDENGRYRTGEDEESWANELYVMTADGDDQRRLTESKSLDERAPAWSPDGSLVAYVREGPASFVDQLMLVRADGACERILAGDATDASVRMSSFDSPAWRPGRVTGNAAQPCRSG